MRIWKIRHSSPGCCCVWILRVVYFPVKHSCLYNRYMEAGEQTRNYSPCGFSWMSTLRQYFKSNSFSPAGARGQEPMGSCRGLFLVEISLLTGSGEKVRRAEKKLAKSEVAVGRMGACVPAWAMGASFCPSFLPTRACIGSIWHMPLAIYKSALWGARFPPLSRVIEPRWVSKPFHSTRPLPRPLPLPPSTLPKKDHTYEPLQSRDNQTMNNLNLFMLNWCTISNLVTWKSRV